MKIKNPLVVGVTAIVLLVLISGWAAAQGRPPRRRMRCRAAAFTYQGQLDRCGAPFTGVCSFQFSLWDALSGGVRRGSIQTVSNLSVNQGRFTALLNQGNEFGGLPFNGEARWLQVAVQCPGDAAFNTLSPRQALTGASVCPLAHPRQPHPACRQRLWLAVSMVTSGSLTRYLSQRHAGIPPGAVGMKRSGSVRGLVQHWVWRWRIHGVYGIAHQAVRRGAGVYGFSD